MPKLKAKREGTLVYLPKYVNAEMLMLEFLRGGTFAINPAGNALLNGDADNYHGVNVYLNDERKLSDLVYYINANIADA